MQAVTELYSLGSLHGQDLAGWEIAECAFLELVTQTSGSFPALASDTHSPVLVRDRALLRHVWEVLEKKDARVSEVLMLVHTETGTAFSMQEPDPHSSLRAHVYTAKEIISLCSHRDAVYWTPGLIGGGKSGPPPVFEKFPQG